MRKIECLKFRYFIHSERSELEIMAAIFHWYLSCLLGGCQWMIIVLTKAAGKGTGKNIDIYTFEGDISREDLLSLIAEELKKEEIIPINCFLETPLFRSFL